MAKCFFGGQARKKEAKFDLFIWPPRGQSGNPGKALNTGNFRLPTSKPDAVRKQVNEPEQLQGEKKPDGGGGEGGGVW